MGFIQRTYRYVMNLPRLYSIGGGVVIVVLVGVGVHVATRQASVTATVVQTPHVHVATVAGLSSASGPLTVIGKVSSLNEATILAQTSGEVVTLTKQVGDSVAAGEEIGAFENSSQVAAVQQAQGAYDAAVAAQSATSLPTAVTQAADVYRAAYTTLDTDLHNDVDSFFGPQTAYGPALLINSKSGDSTTLSRERANLDDLMDAWQAKLAGADQIDPMTLLNEAYANTQTISAFVNELAQSANDQDSRATSAQIADLATARASINGLLSTITAAQNTYRGQSVGATDSASAAIEEAEGALNGAKANLAKTIIRSPISGTIVSLPISQGDFVPAFSTVAQVSNPGALEVDAYVTSDDAKTLAEGNAVTIDGDTDGTIISIAPALDPTTNEIPVKIGITGSQEALTDGDSVTVSLTRSAALSTIAPTTASSTITIPIVATKITPQGPIVFTVSSSTLAAHPITLGTILGDQVTVTGGLTPDLQIVTDARGLSDGETVVVDTP